MSQIKLVDPAWWLRNWCVVVYSGPYGISLWIKGNASCLGGGGAWVQSGIRLHKADKEGGNEWRGVCTRVTINPHLQGAQQSSPNCVQTLWEIRADLPYQQNKKHIIKTRFYFLQSLIQYLNMWIYFTVCAFKGSDFVFRPAVSRMWPSPCCLLWL